MSGDGVIVSMCNTQTLETRYPLKENVWFCKCGLKVRRNSANMF